MQILKFCSTQLSKRKGLRNKKNALKNEYDVIMSHPKDQLSVLIMFDLLLKRNQAAWWGQVVDRMEPSNRSPLLQPQPRITANLHQPRRLCEA